MLCYDALLCGDSVRDGGSGLFLPEIPYCWSGIALM